MRTRNVIRRTPRQRGGCAILTTIRRQQSTLTTILTTILTTGAATAETHRHKRPDARRMRAARELTPAREAAARGDRDGAALLQDDERCRPLGPRGLAPTDLSMESPEMTWNCP